MKKLFLLLIMIACIESMLVQCKKENSNSEETGWTTYTISDGLASNNILAIAIDKEGNKWFGTDAGVSKFNGTNWTNYTTSNGLVGNYVNTIAIDKEGNKWFGTGYDAGSEINGIPCGVSKFDGTNWTNYTTSDGLAIPSVTIIAIDKEDNKWFAYRILTWQKKSMLTNKPDCFHPYSGGVGVTKFDGTNWKHYSESDGLLDGIVYSIAADKEGNLWIGGPCGVTKFDGSTWTYYTMSDGLVYGAVYAIAIDKDGNKWFGTTEGVSKFDGTNWTNYTTSDGLVNNDVRAIAIDLQGNKWFGTVGGISKFDGTRWTNFIIADSPASNYVIAIAIDEEGNKWFGTPNGVSKLSD